MYNKQLLAQASRVRKAGTTQNRRHLQGWDQSDENSWHTVNCPFTVLQTLQGYLDSDYDGARILATFTIAYVVNEDEMDMLLAGNDIIAMIINDVIKLAFADALNGFGPLKGFDIIDW
jgi:hypothetical protein